MPLTGRLALFCNDSESIRVPPGGGRRAIAFTFGQAFTLVRQPNLEAVFHEEIRDLLIGADGVPLQAGCRSSLCEQQNLPAALIEGA